jgi:hypothetical protein
MRILDKGVQYVGIYRLHTNLVELVHASRNLGEPSIFGEECAKNVWHNAMDIGSKHNVELSFYGIDDFRG